MNIFPLSKILPTNYVMVDGSKYDVGMNNIDTTTPNGRLVFGIFTALLKFEAELIAERIRVGLSVAHTRGRMLE